MASHELSVIHPHAETYSTESCYQCRFACGSLVSRTEKGHGDTFGDVLERRLSRRGLLKAGLVATAALAVGPQVAAASAPTADARALIAAAQGPASQATKLNFVAIKPDTSDKIVVAEGYTSEVLLSWGDPLVAGLPPFDLNSQSADSQAQRFGFNCDFVAYTPLPYGSESAGEGLLWVNHEYTDGLMMFPGYDPKSPTHAQVDTELAAHGGSVVLVRRSDKSWTYDAASTYNRRITATTPMTISGPAAGDDLLKTSGDPTGTRSVGMLNNCGGGWTPWGTILTAEENFNQYFANAGMLAEDDPRKKVHARYGLPVAASERLWETFYDRFDIAKEPNEPFHYGWVVEVDPYEPASTPVKRTALGRFKHEAASTVLAPGGKIVVYTGDDERFDYIYKFVSEGSFNPSDRAANKTLLDRGTLYVAKLNDDGSGQWMPLTFGQGPLTAANGWRNQADVLIRTRQAADALGATKMDRPEDIEVNPVTGKVYAALTNNSQRGTDGKAAPDKANPRATNTMGHIIEWTEDGGNHASLKFSWEIFLLAGKPDDESTYFGGFAKDQVSMFACPDNIAFDTRGNLWIATDGQPSALKVNDSVHGVATTGSERGGVKQLLSAVPGSEVASLHFNRDDTALFVSIQHPGEGGSLASPTSVWPNGVANPSVIVVTRINGGSIGM